ncbi:hypothetical protein C5167_044437 [Papaver somniferum]|uniref:Uncharacterized protein n=1 Tax=Papaver somniferum TaxID=3469 RepID=A0A4Y7LBH9_PAPSO|nr:hypothetical protein C5167_044437 [Papaver somniferum]
MRLRKPIPNWICMKLIKPSDTIIVFKRPENMVKKEMDALGLRMHIRPFVNKALSKHQRSRLKLLLRVFACTGTNTGTKSGCSKEPVWTKLIYLALGAGIPKGLFLQLVLLWATGIEISHLNGSKPLPAT